MIVLDANVLISAVDRDAPRHAVATGWMQRQAAAGEVLGMPWVCLLALVRICTLPSVLARPLGIDQALAAAERLLGNAEGLRLLPDGPEHYPAFSRLLRQAGVGGNLTTDALVAAIALAHGGRVASFDRDFARFDGIQVIVPN
ncbi:MAG: PIN domain-containing protein [Xanthomonadales bacterium]|nr:Ribonuclease VapC37 [Xanthomonadales bacterium]MCC6594604.1 PIN domain-containing protein [Xanthomonadales bacterium]MCE7932804.1 PIN domain-containing protein [Xanthomonadales bacterium PRO6]